LAVGNRNTGAVGDDVVTTLGVGAATAYALAALDHKGIHIQCLAIEKLLPLVCQNAAQCANTCFNKSHTMFSFL